MQKHHFSPCGWDFSRIKVADFPRRGVGGATPKFHLSLRQNEFPTREDPFGGNDLPNSIRNLPLILIMLCSTLDGQHHLVCFSRIWFSHWSSSWVLPSEVFPSKQGVWQSYLLLPVATLYTMEHLKKTNPLHLVHIFCWKMLCICILGLYF